ncbi:MAG: sigma-54-dependent Fis family transcriptional regulator [Deltaproteobacteria bacterium]|nr:MAG: sigma-54-dependent Fis family transcriptional regulator [Deltaproteobacteria bacterium]
MEGPMALDDTSLAGRRVLVVDDHGPTSELLRSFLGELGARVDTASGGGEALGLLEAGSYDLVLLDLRMDDMDGLQVLERARAHGATSTFVLMSAEGTISHAVQAMQLGAADFLVKPFELERLVTVIERVLGDAPAGSTGEDDPRLAWRDRYAPYLIGEHESLREVFFLLERIAPTDCTVLVTGESGTGKELVARAIHAASTRADRAFVPVNCGAIPETLIESELFGHAKGAFSGATCAREGRFAVADKGTLFLDEIGEMALPIQVKFLRVLQEGEYVPVGETRPRKCDVRVVAATNRNLESMVAEGTFREDLFYRLNLIPIHLPPLRERRSDIPLLVRHFLQNASQRRGRPVTDITEDALERMVAYDWPGNVRELENTVERMCLLHQGGGILGTADLPAKLRTTQPSRSPTAVVPEDSATAQGTEPPADVSGTAFDPSSVQLPDEGLDLRGLIEELENHLIDQALARTGGNRSRAAQLLGLNRTTLVERLRKRERAAAK